MWNSEQKNSWQDLKKTWNDQPQSETITYSSITAHQGV